VVLLTPKVFQFCCCQMELKCWRSDSNDFGMAWFLVLYRKVVKVNMGLAIFNVLQTNFDWNRKNILHPKFETHTGIHQLVHLELLQSTKSLERPSNFWTPSFSSFIISCVFFGVLLIFHYTQKPTAPAFPQKDEFQDHQTLIISQALVLSVLKSSRRMVG